MAAAAGGRRHTWSRIARERAEQIASRLSSSAAGALAAGWTAVIGLLGIGLVVMAAWVTGAGEGDVSGALEFAGLVWLEAHYVAIDLPAGVISIAPIGLLALPGFLLWRSGAWAARRSGACQWRHVRSAAAFAAGVYGTVGLLVSSLSQIGPAHAGGLRALAGTYLIALVAFGAGYSHEAGLWPAAAQRFSSQFRRWVAAAAAASLVIVAGVSGLIAISLSFNFGVVLELTRSLRPGFLGGAMLLVIAVLYLPNAIGWGVGYVSGAGFSVGDSVLVSPFQAAGGDLPAFPLLAAIPTVGGGWMLLVLLLPLVGGIAAEAMLSRERPTTCRGLRCWRERAWVGVLVAAGAWLLARLSGGSLGSGRLSELGPAPLLTAVAVAVLVVAGMLSADISGATWRRYGPKRRAGLIQGSRSEQ